VARDLVAATEVKAADRSVCGRCVPDRPRMKVACFQRVSLIAGVCRL
jgi:hypothetical protein